MIATPDQQMTVANFLNWVDALPTDGRYELDHGVPVAMSPGTAQHVRAIMSTAGAISAAIDFAPTPCEVFSEGLGVLVDDNTAYIPDVSVNCGKRLEEDARFLSNPVVVIEVLSPYTKRVDKHIKLNGYFKVASIRHYVIVDFVDRIVFHHQRGENGLILTAILREGKLLLDPPGLSIPIGDMFGA
ncbi:MAG: Uma2 family endonuclease [Rhodomicrobium sp.]